MSYAENSPAALERRTIDWHGAARGAHDDLTRAGIKHPSLDLLGMLLAEEERRRVAADLANNVNKFAYTDRMAVEDEMQLNRMTGCRA